MVISEFTDSLATWGSLDTWIVVTAALAAMSCALPGSYLLLRRQSMMGDALSHTVLPGIVAAFLLTHWMRNQGWLASELSPAFIHTAMMIGAAVIGVFSALLTEWIQKLGRVESSAAMGVVFTSLFAFGLLLIRAKADSVHIDPDCVLYGTIETVVLMTFGDTDIPNAALMNGFALLVNLTLVVVFFKELQISTFDPDLSKSLGINPRMMHYALMAITASTLVAAFESVGSILVIAMLIAPAATAYLLTDRLKTMIGLSLVIAAASAVLGHVMAITLPKIIFSRLGFDTIEDASTAGMMAAACGCLFVCAAMFGPRHGVISKLFDRFRVRIRIASEDVLGLLYRFDERQISKAESANLLIELLGAGPIVRRFAIRSLIRQGLANPSVEGIQLTDSGRHRAKKLVRSHRLWESYMRKHFTVPDDHLHDMAERVEHFIEEDMRAELAAELDGLETDPHGRVIPSEDETP